MATGCNDKKSDDSLDIFRDEKSAENFYINKTKATKNKTLSLEVTPYQWYEVLASEFVVKVGANLLWECRNMISTINIQDLQADIFTYSDYSLAVSSEEYLMYTTGITIKWTYAEDFKARFQMMQKLRYSDLIDDINY